MVMDGYGWLLSITTGYGQLLSYQWLWMVFVNGCMSSCAGSLEKNWLLLNHHDLFLTVQDERTTMRVENTITMYNWLPTKFTK